MRGLFHHLHGMKARTAPPGGTLPAIRGPVLWLTLRRPAGGGDFRRTIIMTGEFRECTSVNSERG
jgi:hypothetical protein